MRKNLLKEMIDFNVSEEDLSVTTGLTRKTIKNKISGKYDFSLSEVILIKDTHFPGKEIEYLFHDFEDKLKAS
ncbi:hypothetical protein [Acetobacterium malicum]|uniref:hypothetical protein n=1 Tax=Acetobacterium malicum TaxID=52692 RepID=UPI003593FAD9